MGISNAITLALPWVTQLVFVIAVGCCIGSLINVLVYRLPRGIGVVTPPSACPKCETRLTWRENIPVLGWLLLRGRCRFCGVRISAEYPLVEAFTGGLFALCFALWYLVPPRGTWLGVVWGTATPEWALNGLGSTWPIAVVCLVLVGCLIAMTLVDAKTFTIPLLLAWVPTLLAAFSLPTHAFVLTLMHGPFDGYAASTATRWFFEDGEDWRCASGWLWSLPTPRIDDFATIGATIGATTGLGVSVLLVKFRIISQSFADYNAWEAEVRATAASEREAANGSPDGPDTEDSGAQSPDPFEADDPTMWTQYPYARREMIKELAFIGPSSVLAVTGAWVAPRLVEQGSIAPLWLTVLAGVLLGYLVGGGIVWAVRIFGSLAFAKEAMGIGDVHLLAAVGACIGWIDAVAGFFAAAFLALGWAILGAIAGGKLQRAMPFGPFLAVGAVLVFLAKPLFEILLTGLMNAPSPIDLP